MLIWLDGLGHETSLHRTLTAHPAITSGGLLVATTATDPAARVWLPAAATRRVHLTDIPTAGQQRAA